ncbi:hypothetical protein VTK73DRAFT_9298 [Phialemonium thermophilum]|uniref:Sialidase n=1 Tax=Phialemonium thermophilum TaxID=223376 RepID=A0ABR3XLS8_9PEZI
MITMSTVAADLMFDVTCPPPCEPATPPSFSFDPSLLEIPYYPGHARSSSHGSIYSFESSPSDSAVTCSTRRTTPARSPIRTHGPLLLPKIRTQDQAFAASGGASVPPPKRVRTASPPATLAPLPDRNIPTGHTRSYTNPETIAFATTMSFNDGSADTPSLLCSPISFTPAPENSACHSRRASTCSLDNAAIEKYGFPTYRNMPAYVAAPGPNSRALTPQPQAQPQIPSTEEPFNSYQAYAPRAPSPLAHSSMSPEPVPSTTLMEYLTSPNPAPALVRTISFPLRDPHTKHFWWDVRQIRPWQSFNVSTVLSLPCAAALLYAPVPVPLLPVPVTKDRHPETESALHSIYASHFLPRLNAALALSSMRPLQFSCAPKTSPSSSGMATDCMFVADVAGGSASAAAIFGGKPTARVVGLVKSFDRFNTGMRVEGNVKRVEYLRGLAHLHYAMREHGCRYGFILTEIELVFVRNGEDSTPYFGYLEVGSVQLAAAGTGGGAAGSIAGKEASETCNGEQTQMTACLALWGLCMLAGDEPALGQPHWRSQIGAPAEGTRRKALPRDDWMPQPQLAEKREAKRARGWVWPEDAVGKKEIGKRGVRYGAC